MRRATVSSTALVAITTSTFISPKICGATYAQLGSVSKWRSSYGPSRHGPRLPENLRVEIPCAQLLLFPYEIVANAKPPARRALHDRRGRVRQPVCNIFRHVLDVEHGLVGKRFGQFRMPLNARQQLDVPHRRDECVLVLRRKRAIDPVRQVRKRNPDVLPRIADNDADRRPRYRHEPGRNGPVRRSKAIDEAEAAAAAAQHEDTRLVAQI